MIDVDLLNRLALIAELTQEPETYERYGQPEEPPKKKKLLSNMFPEKVPWMKNDSFGSMEDLKKSRP